MAVRPHAGGTSFSEFDYDEDRAFVWRGHDGAAQADDYRLSYPGDPIHIPRRRGSSIGRALVISLALCAAGWGALKTEAIWRPWVSDQIGEVMAALERASSGDGQRDKFQGHAVADMNPVQRVEPIATGNVADAPRVGAGVVVTGREEGEAKASAAVSDAPVGTPEASSKHPDASAKNGTQDGTEGETGPASQLDSTPLPPPKINPADPYQTRALAVGLHPELSRVLLSRLSDADFRNAGIAIQKAVAEAGDGDNFIWPRQREPKLALFKVHFVAGAAPDCRRYVVVVTKDGWSTTAQPMERCGVKRLGGNAS